jgi:hypothetical protein
VIGVSSEEFALLFQALLLAFCDASLKVLL